MASTFGVLVISLGTYEDSHYPILFVLPLLSAAFRFSFPAALATMAIASSLTIAQVWVSGRSRPQMAPSEYFESVTIALIYAVVTPVVAMLMRGLLEGAEREEGWTRFTAAAPGFREYEQRTTRTDP